MSRRALILIRPPRPEHELRLGWAIDLSRSTRGDVNWDKVKKIMKCKLLDVLMSGSEALGKPQGLRARHHPLKKAQHEHSGH